MLSRDAVPALLLLLLTGCSSESSAPAPAIASADVGATGGPAFDPSTPAPAGSGTLDATFGDAGKRAFDADVAAAWSAAVGADGSIVLGGTIGGGAVVRRLDDHGVTDPGFGVDGTVRIGDGAVRSVALAGGSILAAGIDGAGNGFVARLLKDGGLDPAFGDGGLHAIAGTAVEALLGLADGSVVVAGESGPDVAVEHLTADGKSISHSVVDLGGASDLVHAIARAADGRLLLAGAAGGRFAVARLSPEGALDPSFGTAGIAATFNGEAFSVVALPDGGVAAAGSDFLVARYSSAGTLDPAFGGTGVVRGSEWMGVAHDLAVLPGGALAVLGSGDPGDFGPDSDLVVTRLKPDGSIDGAFAGGLLSVDFDHRRETASRLVPGGDGRALLLGLSEQEDSVPRIALARCWL